MTPTRSKPPKQSNPTIGYTPSEGNMSTAGKCAGYNGNCDHPILARGLCRGHYLGWKKGKPVDRPLRGYRAVDEQLVPPRVASKVRDAIKAVCQQRGISEYEFMRRLVEDWYASYERLVPAARPVDK